MLTHADLITGLGSHLRQALGVAASPIERAVADSRLCRPGDLFAALPGEFLDGGEYVADAFARGAVAAITARAPERVPDGCTAFVVDEPLAALQTLAGWWRDRFDPRVLAITGTAGKTSTKEIAAHLLGAGRRVLKTEASLNGDIGLPLMLLRLRPEHEVAVLELGLFWAGEIALQCRLAKPQLGIVTNVGHTHAERLGSIEAIARAKRELVEALPADGMVALNGDDPRVAAMAAVARCRVVTYGLDGAHDLRGTEIQARGLDGLSFTIEHQGARVAVETPLIGRHNARNCLAAAAVALHEGMPLDQIATALATARNPLRLLTFPGPNGSTIIDDTYNAGPDSMAAALDVLATAPGRKIAVLGDMLELGEEEERLHRALGEQAGRVCDLLFLVGERARWIAAGAAGNAPITHALTTDGLAESLRALIEPGDIVLLKASRGMALDRVVAALRAEPAVVDGAPGEQTEAGQTTRRAV